MDQQRRLLLFGFSAFLTLFVWATLGPKLFPGMFPQPRDVAVVDGGNDAAADGTSTDDEGATAAGVADSGEGSGKVGDAVEPPEVPPTSEKQDPTADGNKPEIPVVNLPAFPTQTVMLGSMDLSSGYALQIQLTSVGASVQSATLTDPRYPVAGDVGDVTPRPQLRVVGNNLLSDESIRPLTKSRGKLTVDLDVVSIDKLLAELDVRASLRTVNWELLETEKDANDSRVLSGATFRIVSPDGSLEVRKIFQLQRVPADRLAEADIRQIFAPAYQLDVAIQLRNIGKKTVVAEYLLQGPVGLPLEDVENARKFRDVKVGFLNDSGSVSAELMTSSALVKDAKKGTVEEWTRPVRYAGVDVQFFAALILPTGDQLARQTFSTVTPTVITTDEKNTERSDISLELKSAEFEIPADGLVQHEFQMFLGPKSQDLLFPYKADSIIDYGWFGSISHVMVYLLKTFHGWGVHYGIAIVMLTVLVRGMMFPVSRKQAASSKKMKDLQPQLTALREKHKDDKQKLAQAQMELYREANFNPFAGCLPVFLQLPIFISLYQALNNWVDLRMASFMWVENLAAPDALFEMPFSLPFLGSDFNLLPMITIVLFYAQQKMFMPPPTTDEMAMQQKMMNFMMIFMGFLFYRVPAGLCVYFIASSAWGMSERKLLEFLPEKAVDEEKLRRKKEKRGDGFFGKFVQQMQAAAEMQEQIKKNQREGNGNDSQAKSGSPKRRK
ncbi:MAG: YidC/Oxa1 family insertase periplasmic-domain containing protein [Planctomycetota bacterium]|nr:YidC/Oxa1 family insertase periplasmic-domain containing protein [Planctomycetota bacterium]